VTTRLTLDFVSDVVCPWCVIGLLGLEEALRRLEGVVEAQIRLQPFELNPAMPFEGQLISEHVQEKYGRSTEESRGARDMIRARAADLGFEMRTGPESRIYNTFAAHQLIAYAETEGRALPLKHAFFQAYFQEGLNPSDPAVLRWAAEAAGLDAAEGLRVVAAGIHADDVRRAEGTWTREGITGVPTVILEDRYLLVGAQPPDAYEKALRSIAKEKVAA